MRFAVSLLLATMACAAQPAIPVGLEDCDDVAFDGAGSIYLACHSRMDGIGGRPALGRMDAYVVKMDGPRVVWSAQLGGSEHDAALRVAVAGDGDVWVSGITSSREFAVTPDAAQKAYGGGGADGFVARFNARGERVYASFVGGAGWDIVDAIAVGWGGELLLAGTTESEGFAGRAAGGRDGFFGVWRAGALRLMRFGGAKEEKVTGLAWDRRGEAVLAGYTRSADFQVRRPLQGDLRGSIDGFVMRVRVRDLALRASTYLGGKGEDSVWGVAVDRRGETYVAGTTDFSDFVGPASGGEDAFLAKLDRRGRRTRWATRMGGWENDRAGYDGGIVSVDANGAVWMAGATSARGLAAGSAWQKEFGGGAKDGFLAALDARSGRICLLSYSGGEGDEAMESVAVGPSGQGAATRLTVRQGAAGEVTASVALVTFSTAAACR